MRRDITTDPLTTEQFAELATSTMAWAEYTVRGTDGQGWAFFLAWARGHPLSWRQYRRVHAILVALFAASGASPAAQEIAAYSYDDEGGGHGYRKGPASTWRLLVRARLLVGRGVAPKF